MKVNFSIPPGRPEVAFQTVVERTPWMRMGFGASEMRMRHGASGVYTLEVQTIDEV